MLQRFFSPCMAAATRQRAAFLPSIISSPSASWTNNSPSSQSSQSPVTAAIRHRSSRSTRGLFDGKDVRFGNNVPFSMKKTRRKWNPNVQYQKLYSEILDESIKFKVTTAALRSIDKAGGLDNYLLTSKHVINNKSVGGNKGQQGMGQQVRNRIMQKLQHQKNLKKEAVARGENVDDWDKIVLIGKKIKSSQSQGVVEEDNVATASS